MIRNFKDLQKFCPNINPEIKYVIEKFGIQIPEYYANLIDWNNPEDPLFKVAVPSTHELKIQSYEVADPIGDDTKEFSTKKTEMLVHRYPDRALILTTNKCAGRCRYCFRRDKVFDTDELFSESEFEKSLDYIRKTKHLREVVLSGGDPLCMPRKKLYDLLDYIIANCPHIKTVRLHTRAIVYNPAIATNELAKRLNSFARKIPLVIMTHIVHPREITPIFKEAITKFNCVKLNQAPLLKGVNDSVETLCSLSYKLLEVGILPHYLHLLDKAKGTSHFRISIAEAQNLVARMMGHIGGHLVPKLILDTPYGIGKVWLNKSFIQKDFIKDGKRHLEIQSTHSPEKSFDYIDECNINNK